MTCRGRFVSSDKLVVRWLPPFRRSALPAPTSQLDLLPCVYRAIAGLSGRGLREGVAADCPCTVVDRDAAAEGPPEEEIGRRREGGTSERIRRQIEAGRDFKGRQASPHNGHSMFVKETRLRRPRSASDLSLRSRDSPKAAKVFEPLLGLAVDPDGGRRH